MPQSLAFEHHLEAARLWLNQLSTSLQLSREEHPRAVNALRAGLHAIRDRLPAVEVVDLGAQLPTLIRGIYYEGWTLRSDPGEIRDRSALIARVKRELSPDPRLSATDVLRAVIRLLVDHVSAGEIKDVLATLPRPIAQMWSELAQPEASAPTQETANQEAGQPRRMR